MIAGAIVGENSFKNERDTRNRAAVKVGRGSQGHPEVRRRGPVTSAGSTGRVSRHTMAPVTVSAAAQPGQRNEAAACKRRRCNRARIGRRGNLAALDDVTRARRSARSPPDTHRSAQCRPMSPISRSPTRTRSAACAAMTFPTAMNGSAIRVARTPADATPIAASRCCCDGPARSR
jgi:hypothetical protein